MVNDPNRPVQFVFAGKAHPLDEPGKRVLQQIAEMMRDSKFRDKFVFIEDYDINVGTVLGPGCRRVAEQSSPSAGSFGYERSEGRAQRRPESFDSRWLVGGGFRRHEWLRDRNRADALQHECPRHPRRRRLDAHPARGSDSALLPARSRRLAARLDQAHEAHHPHPGLALQCRPHGDGLHAASATFRRRAEHRANCDRARNIVGKPCGDSRPRLSVEQSSTSCVSFLRLGDWPSARLARSCPLRARPSTTFW